MSCVSVCMYIDFHITENALYFTEFEKLYRIKLQKNDDGMLKALLLLFQSIGTSQFLRD